MADVTGIPSPRTPADDQLTRQAAVAAARTVADRQRLAGDSTALAAIARLRGVA